MGNSTTDYSRTVKITVSEEGTDLDLFGRFDDGSDDKIVSPTLANKAALSGIGKLQKIVTVRLSVALKSGDEAQ